MKYRQSGEIDGVIEDNPGQQEGEEAIHEMLLQHILVLDHLLLHSQVLEHVQVAQQRTAQDEHDDPWESQDLEEGDEEAEEEAEDLLGVEEGVEDLVLGELGV